jgi:predicted phage tail protein
MSSFIQGLLNNVVNTFGGTGGSTESTGVVYDLLSEGEIELVGGLSGIFLNRTPIVNFSAVNNVQSATTSIILVNNLTFSIIGSYGSNIQNVPILVISGGKQSTVSSLSGQTITTTSNFFSSDMINGNSGAGALVPQVRIQGGNLDGSEYVGRVVSVSSATTATLFPAVAGNAAGKIISFDFYTTGTLSSTGIGITDVTLNNPIPNFSNLSTGSARALIQNLDSNIPGSANDNKNFKFVLANFRNGTLSQSNVVMPAFTNASLGVNKNTPIKQFTTYFNNSKLNNFWGKYTLKRPTGATGGPSIVINASEVSPGAAGQVDELLLTISAPSGLYAANSEGKARTWGAVFQIFFKYKNGDEAFKSQLIYGPTDAQVAAASILISADSGTFNRYGATPSGTIRAASKSAIDFDFRWSVEEFKPFTDFQVEIKKVTTDSLEYNNDQIVAETAVKSLQAFINDKLSYPYAAYSAIAFDSLEFAGEFPERAYRCRGIRTDIPTNYVTREEASDGIAVYNRTPEGNISSNYQIWDGTFRRGYTNNPIWNLRELLLNKRWGLGHWVDDSMINNYSLYPLARYCDELVPDGIGGLEPRFTCGVYLTEPVEAYKVIRDFCTTMLAIPYWVDGQLILEADRPAEPVYTFTKGNIEGGIFSYEGTGNKTRPNQIAVKYNNKDNFYEPDLELVDDIEDMISKNRIFVEETTAFGATTRGQAIRYGKWKLLTSKLQKEIVSFKTGENAAYLKPGSIVNIQDADKNSVRYSGRLISATTNSAVLDSPVVLNSGEDYTLHVFIVGPATYLVQDSVTFSAAQIGTELTFQRGDQLPSTIGGTLIDSDEKASEIVDKDGKAVDVQFVKDAHIESKTISNTKPFTGANLTVTGAFTSAPEAETVWAITVKRQGALVDGSAKQYKILSIGEEAEGLYSITAAEHFNSKFDIIDEEYLGTPPRSVPRYVEVPSITEFSGKVTTSRQTNDESVSIYVPNIELSWVGPRSYVNNVLTLYNDFDSYALEVKSPNGDTSIITLPKSSSRYTINNVVEGVYEFTLRARSAVGPVSNPSRISVAVSLTSRKSSNIVSTLPTGGSFSRDIDIGTSISAPSSYRFTADSGVSVTVSPTEPSITRGNYWSDNIVTRVWDGVGWRGVDPTYRLSGPSSVIEGQSLTITLTTIGIANGTQVPYTITGITSADIGGATLTGNFTVNSNTATLVLNITSDADTGETLQLTLNNQMDYIRVVIQEA